MAVNLTGRLTALQVMQDATVIPVIVLHDVAHAVPMACALVAGGIRMLEVTLRTPQALACMEAIAKEVEGAVVGAGTVRSPADAAAAAKAGARFAVRLRELACARCVRASLTVVQRLARLARRARHAGRDAARVAGEVARLVPLAGGVRAVVYRAAGRRGCGEGA